jgi:SNF2 family DNA or RNA helicase
MDMGTGKSRTSIELVDRRKTKIDKVIWFCPVSLKEAVKQEILKHTDCTTDAICVFSNKTNERNVPAVLWYIVGIESMSSSDRVVLAINKLVTDQTFVICDESSYIKGHRATRTLRITELSKRARYRLILTGTPLSQGVVDLFAQMRFLSPKILGYDSFYSFAANHLEYSDKFPGMIVRAHNVPYLATKIKPYVYQVTKEECLDLPDKLYGTRYFSMTREQREYYEWAKDEILSEIDEHDDYFTSITIFRLFSVLQGIACGFWNRKGEMLEFEHDRLKTLMNTIYDIPRGRKVIIWTKYRYDIEHIREMLGEDVALFYGDLNERRRQHEVEKFRNGARFFLATQSCGGHGLTLNEAHYVIFYNNAFKYSERLQAEDRCHRIGQEHKVTYIDIHCSNSIDDRIAAALAEKGSTVHAFRREVDKVKNQKGKLRRLIESL